MNIIQKRAVTILEIMIVIFIIGIIGSVLGYNMKGSLDEGRSFKSEQGSKMVHDVLTLSMAEGATLSQVVNNAQRYLDQSGFIKNSKKVLKDGWNQNYQIQKTSDIDFVVYSHKWEEHLRNKKKLDRSGCQEDYPWAFHFDNLDEFEDEE